MKATEKDILGVIMDMVNEGRARNGRWNSNRNRTATPPTKHTRP